MTDESITIDETRNAGMIQTHVGLDHPGDELGLGVEISVFSERTRKAPLS